jgi:hypothetical protein
MALAEWLGTYFTELKKIFLKSGENYITFEEVLKLTNGQWFKCQ